MKNFDEMVVRFANELVKTIKPENITITDGEFRAAAERMLGAGYDITRSANASEALRAYLEGKPIALKGGTGVGKTAFFRALNKSKIAQSVIIIYSVTRHANDYESSIVDDIKAYNEFEFVVDDFGNESTWGGKRTDTILTRIIAVREMSRMRTHFTTNLEAQEIKARYDERVVSRLKCCEWVNMNGSDNRQATANPEIAAFRAKCADPESWVLCAERCAHYKLGKCRRGVAMPPDLIDRLNPRPKPPEECRYFFRWGRMGRDA